MRPMFDVHPEAAHGEVYLGNFIDDDYKSVGWESKRFGKTAYLTDNSVVPAICELRPVFVAYEELMDAGQFDEKIHVYRRKILGDDEAEIPEWVAK